MGYGVLEMLDLCLFFEVVSLDLGIFALCTFELVAVSLSIAHGSPMAVTLGILDRDETHAIPRVFASMPEGRRIRFPRVTDLG